MRHFKIIIFFLLIASMCSLFRFGERENENSVLSDSDYYIDLAQVFYGNKPDINQEYFGGHEHHYNRPLLPVLAGALEHVFLKKNYRAAFSTTNIFLSTLLAFLFYLYLNRVVSSDLNVFPPILFLTSFSQVNWGYHIHTETIGLTMAFLVTYLIFRLIEGIDKFSRSEKIISISIILLAQSAAFLSREVAWINVFVFCFAAIHKKLYQKKYRFESIVILLALFLAKIPHSVYASWLGTHTPPIHFSFLRMVEPGYFIDAVIKVGFVFNISLIPLGYFIFKKGFRSIPYILTGWTIGAIFYIGAGYAHNSVKSHFPPRMAFSLFPLVYYIVHITLSNIFKGRKLHIAMIVFLATHVIFTLIGYSIDAGFSAGRTSHMQSIFDWL